MIDWLTDWLQGDVDDDKEDEEEFKNEMPKDEFRSYKEFYFYEALCRDEETHVRKLKD